MFLKKRSNIILYHQFTTKVDRRIINNLRRSCCYCHILIDITGYDSMIQRSGIKRKRVCPYIANPYLQHPVQSDIGELIHDSNLFLVKACSDMVLHVSTSSSGEDLSLYTGMIGPLMTIQRLQAEVDACKDIAITKPQRVKGSPKGSKKIGFCSQTTAMDMYQCLVNGEIYDLDPHLYDDDSAMSNELLYGRSGLAYLLEYFKKKGLTCARAGMTQAVLSHVKLTEFPWQWGGKEYFGAAHGTAGILLALKKLNDVVVPDLFDELISKSVLASGNFITSQGSTTDRLVQWCHGSPGFVPLILEYYDTAPERYRPVLENALEVIWHRGFLTKGCGT